MAKRGRPAKPKTKVTKNKGRPTSPLTKLKVLRIQHRWVEIREWKQTYNWKVRKIADELFTSSKNVEKIVSKFNAEVNEGKLIASFSKETNQVLYIETGAPSLILLPIPKIKTIDLN